MLVCENGSTDDTVELATDAGRPLPGGQADLVPDADYGRALRAGFLAATGDVVANFDVDGVDLDFLDAAVVRLEDDATVAAVVGQQAGSRAPMTRARAGRRLVTATFSLVLRRGFGLSVSDTHGMKVLGRRQLAPLVEACRYGTDLFDTELLAPGRVGRLHRRRDPRGDRRAPGRPAAPIWSRIPRSTGRSRPPAADPVA